MKKMTNKKVLLVIISLIAITGGIILLSNKGKDFSSFFTGKVERKVLTEKRGVNLTIAGTVVEETDLPPHFPIPGAEVKCGLINSLSAITGTAGEFMLEMPEQARPFFLSCEITAEGYQPKKMNIRIIDRWKTRMGNADVFNIGVIDLIKNENEKEGN